MNEIKTKTIGEAWTGACKYIFEKGRPMKDDDQDIRELLHFVLTIEKPEQKDELVEKYGNKEMIRWMMSNFFDQKKVPELKNADSYGVRLFNYHGKDQVQWVIDKLKKKPEAKSVTIPMLMPNDDSGYIPCVSMLDFKIRDNKLMLVAMCRSIDFGKKVYANMLALNKIQEKVANEIGTKVGPLIMYVVSAHIYDEDYKKVEEILDEINATS
jgi:thymidylate synthase